MKRFLASFVAATTMFVIAAPAASASRVSPHRFSRRSLIQQTDQVYAARRDFGRRLSLFNRLLAVLPTVPTTLAQTGYDAYSADREVTVTDVKHNGRSRYPKDERCANRCEPSDSR